MGLWEQAKAPGRASRLAIAPKSCRSVTHRNRVFGLHQFQNFGHMLFFGAFSLFNLLICTLTLGKGEHKIVPFLFIFSFLVFIWWWLKILQRPSLSSWFSSRFWVVLKSSRYSLMYLEVRFCSRSWVLVDRGLANSPAWGIETPPLWGNLRTEKGQND